MLYRMVPLTRGVALAVLCICTTSLFGAEQLVIAERGKAAEYSIVIPRKALPPQKYAAEELRDFVEKTTGVRLEIVADGESVGARVPRARGRAGRATLPLSSW